MATRLEVQQRRSFAPARSAFALTLLMGAAALTSALQSATAATAKTLQIYFIDVEGGQSTLIVTPDHHSLLIDTGWAGEGGADFKPGDPHQARDANRIVAAARDADVKQIDYLLITHFHSDHVGGVTELAQLMPIRNFVDHGVPNAEALSTSKEMRDVFDAYAAVRKKGTHLEPRPGDRLPLNDVEAIVVSSAGATLTAPLAGAGAMNRTCQDHASPPRDAYENPRSTGLVVRFGRFRFLDVGDLSGEPLFKLSCPRSLIGPVDAYLVAHHGGPDAGDPSTFAAFRPRVAIMNNGVTKGGARNTYQALHKVSGLEDVWQLHASADAADANFSTERIANLDERTAYWIKLVAHEDGSFKIDNQRSGESKSYTAAGAGR